MEPDVKLILGAGDDGDVVYIYAWHQVLAQASSFFRAMLSPNRFQEGETLQKNKYIEIKLPEVNPEAMEIVCNILHLRSSLVPTSDLTSEGLAEIAILVHMLDCAEAVRPWSEKWMERDNFKQEMAGIEEMSSQDLSKWICVCHVLGFPERAKRHVSRLTIHMSDDDLASEQNRYLGHIPQSIVENIKTQRSKVAERFYEVTINLMELLEPGKSCRYPRFSQRLDDESSLLHLVSDDEAFHCSSVLFGNASLALRDSLGETWRSGSWTGSVASMHRSMYTVANRLTGPGWIIRNSLSSKKKRPTHAECSMDYTFRAQVDQIMKEHNLLTLDTDIL